MTTLNRRHSIDRLVGLGVKAAVSTAANSGFDFRFLVGVFLGRVVAVKKIGTSVATLPDAWR